MSLFLYIVQKQKIYAHSRTQKSNLNYSKCMNFAALMTVFKHLTKRIWFYKMRLFQTLVEGSKSDELLMCEGNWLYTSTKNHQNTDRNEFLVWESFFFLFRHS